jgi:hypothetical protein
MTLASASPPTVIRVGADSDGNRRWLVKAETGPAGTYYLVTEDAGARLSCSCRRGRFRQPCAHTAAVADLIRGDVLAATARYQATQRPAPGATALRQNSQPFSLFKL